MAHESGGRCDRILWYGKGVKQLSYFRGESKFSDHRPVSALFSTPIEVMKATNPRIVAMSTIIPTITPLQNTVGSGINVVSMFYDIWKK